MRMLGLALCAALSVVAAVGGPSLGAQGAPPILVMETVKGTIEIQLYPDDAPKSVAHILRLVERNFYRGLRIHRVAGSLVQFGDPTTRSVAQRAYWGRAGSGQVIGEAEFNQRTHTRGAVSLAHSGDARYADSQLFILKSASPSLDGEHVVIGRVTSGMNAVDALEEVDLIRNITLKGAGQ